MTLLKTNKAAPMVNEFVQTYQQRINHLLQRLLPPRHQTPTRLHEAMHYAVMNGGKRIRPLFVYATGLLFTDDLSTLDIPAAAIELIHCYSLVHDDLPDMDNDDFRRGKLSCHKAFDVPTAILVGDALQSLAFEILARENHPHFVSLLAHASGSLGMAGGQQLDLENKGGELTVDQVKMINGLKTGALFRAAILLGAWAGGCKDSEELQKLEAFSADIGLIFQLQDDLHDDHNADQTKLQQTIHQLFTEINNDLPALNGDTAALKTVVEFLRQLSP